MRKELLIVIGGLWFGVLTGFLIILFTPLFPNKPQALIRPLYELGFTQNTVIGFLPYWTLSQAKTDYSPYINTLSYFGLTIDVDGTIRKFSQPGESDPGWLDLQSGKVTPFLSSARQHGVHLSLLLFNANEEMISQLMTDPTTHADNLVKAVTPIMQQYHFTDLNLDIESTKIASNESRAHFIQFIKEVREKMDENHLGTLTVDVTGDSLIKQELIDSAAIAPYVDHIILMAYDFHYIGSMVSGPVAPLNGASTISEYDAQTAVEEALQVMNPNKLILGAPLYGYSWETINESTRSATIPSSGLTKTTKQITSLLQTCHCEPELDAAAQESFIVYKDPDTGTFHQVFYPTAQSTSDKIALAKDKNLGGIALWALGFEDSTILEPLQSYK